jgi:CRISPR/Cas system CSM-associated protein Csm4 (group 5 of RAMP superfamily)
MYGAMCAGLVLHEQYRCPGKDDLAERMEMAFGLTSEFPKGGVQFFIFAPFLVIRRQKTDIPHIQNKNKRLEKLHFFEALI